MSSFYGGAATISSDTINHALGFTPVMYALTFDQEGQILKLKPINNTQTAASEQNIYIQLQDMDTTPCLIATYQGRRFKFIGEEIVNEG